MTREERELSIEYLEKIKEDYIEGNAYERHPLPEYYAIENAIKALGQEPKWVPVTERLPDKDGLYLVSVKNDHERRYSKTCWYSDKNWFARQDVVAWQLLPEPYKAESEGKE